MIVLKAIGYLVGGIVALVVITLAGGLILGGSWWLVARVFGPEGPAPIP